MLIRTTFDRPQFQLLAAQFGLITLQFEFTSRHFSRSRCSSQKFLLFVQIVSFQTNRHTNRVLSAQISTSVNFGHAIHRTVRIFEHNTRRESSKSAIDRKFRAARSRACGRASVVCEHQVSSYPRHAGSPGEKGELGPTGPPGLPGEKGARGKQGKRVSFSEVLRPPPTIDQSNPRTTIHPPISYPAVHSSDRSRYPLIESERSRKWKEIKKKGKKRKKERKGWSIQSVPRYPVPS